MALFVARCVMFQDLNYLPIFILLICSIAVALFALAIPFFLAPLSGNSNKCMTYECGIKIKPQCIQKTGMIKFYLTAVLFVVFDVEIALVLPWVASLSNVKQPMQLFIPMAVFSVIIAVGFIYELHNGVIE